MTTYVKPTDDIIINIRENTPFRYHWNCAQNAQNPFLAFANVGIKTIILLPLVPFAIFGMICGWIVEF